MNEDFRAPSDDATEAEQRQTWDAWFFTKGLGDGEDSEESPELHDAQRRLRLSRMAIRSDGVGATNNQDVGGVR